MISVIIPTYNQRGLLSNAVDTVLSQTYKDVEVIVVDDNNHDTPARKSTEKVMEQYTENPKVKYLKHEKNKNGSAARNTGFRVSKGEYIAFLDDDDHWTTDKLEKQVTYLQTHPQFDGVYCDIIVKGARNPNHHIEGNIVVDYLTNYVSLQTSCLLFTRKAVEKLNGFDESFRRHQDCEFVLRFFFAGMLMGCVPEYLSYMDCSGGNNVSGERLNELKAHFLSLFDEQINNLERQQPGIKKEIIVANYVKVFESHFANKNYKLAWGLFRKYFFMSPKVFVCQCYRLLLNHYKRAKSRKSKGQ